MGFFHSRASFLKHFLEETKNYHEQMQSIRSILKKDFSTEEKAEEKIELIEKTLKQQWLFNEILSEIQAKELLEIKENALHKTEKSIAKFYKKYIKNKSNALV